MKIMQIATASIAMLAISICSAEAADNFYLEAEVGNSFIRDVDADGSGGLTGRLRFDDDLVFGAAVGYRFGENIRLEGRLSYRKYDIESVTVDFFTFSGSSDADVFSGMVNAYYDFTLTPWLKPYIGAGIGAVDIDVNNDTNLALDVKYPDTTFSWNLLAGINVPINDQFELVFGYRRLEADDPDFEAQFFGIDGKGETEYVTHEAIAGLRYNF